MPDLSTANLWKIIGSTPMIALRYSYGGGPEQQVLVKCEQYNLTGSITDRVALYILQKAQEQGDLHSGDLIVEASAGDSGLSYAAVGKALGFRVLIIMPDTVSLEHRAAIKAKGAGIKLAGKTEAPVKLAEAMAHLDGIFLPKRFAEKWRVEAHEQTTGREIGHFLLLEELSPSALVMGVKSGAAITGISRYLHKVFPDMLVKTVQVSDSPTLVDFARFGQPLTLAWGDALVLQQKLAGELRLEVGATSAVNLLGAIKWQQEYGQNKTVLTVFPDSCKKKNTAEVQVLPSYLSAGIDLLGYQVLAKI
jgi:cysteine synthase A